MLECKICNKCFPIKGFYNHIRLLHLLSCNEYKQKYMIEEEKEKNDKFKVICLECGKKFLTNRGLRLHIYHEHIGGTESYYDKYLKKEGEGICLNCKKKTKYSKDAGKYLIFCNKTCANIYNSKKAQKNHNYKESVIKTANTMIARYGKKSPMQILQFRNKKEKTMEEKYGAKNTLQSKILFKKFQNSMIIKYGTKTFAESGLGVKTIKESVLKKYGADNVFKVDLFKKKMHDTMMIRYGVKHILQNLFFKNKQLESCQSKKIYILPSSRQIYLLGNEPLFLDYIFKNDLLKENDINYLPKPITYVFNNEQRIYFPDFYILKFNLIVEIKSRYILKLQTDQIQNKKEIACKELGYKYYLLLDNEFEKFSTFLKSLNG